MSQPSQFTAVIISTIIMVFISVVPLLNILNVFCCAGIIIGGAAGTYYYARQLEKNGMIIHNKDGVMIGLLSGIISAIICVMITTLMYMVLKHNPVEGVYKVMDDLSYKMPPESEQMLRTIFEEYNQKGFSTIMIGTELLTRILTHCIFGPVGGLIVASMINKRRNSLQQ